MTTRWSPDHGPGRTRVGLRRTWYDGWPEIARGRRVSRRTAVGRGDRGRHALRDAWLVVAFVAAAVGLGGCATDDPSGACLAAFRNADPRALPPYGASPLDDAISVCRDVAAWRAAWEAVPAAHPGRTDPIGFLSERCQDPSLASTALCSEAASGG